MPDLSNADLAALSSASLADFPGMMMALILAVAGVLFWRNWRKH